MSLTRILRDPRRKYLKQWFRYYFPNPGTPEEYTIKVESNTSHKGLVGTALDYLLRFNIERINKSISTKQKTHWVAYSGLQQCEFTLSTFAKVSRSAVIGYKYDRRVNALEFYQLLLDRFDQALINYGDFLINGEYSRALLGSALFLAKLDLVVRAGFIDATIDETEEDIVDELEILISKVSWDFFKAKKQYFLNPHFGKASSFVGGADADLIIDNTLIDIKTTQEQKLSRGDLNQIIGYYILSLFGKVNDEQKLKIDKIALYYVRYDYMRVFTISDFYSKKEFRTRAKEFKQLVKDRELSLLSKDQLLKIGVYKISKRNFKCPYCKSPHFTKRKSNTSSYYYKCAACKRQFSSSINVPSNPPQQKK